MSNDIVDVPTGSIPAWAGEPTKGKDQQGQSKVYPRVGGGTLVVKGVVQESSWSIPAWAGEP